MNENDKKRIARVDAAMDSLCRKRGFAAPVEVLKELGLLSEKDYRNWRAGRVDYLERVVQTNLSKLTKIMREIRAYAMRHGLKPSYTVYCVSGSSRRLRFSRSGDPSIERNYATHYVDRSRTAELKEEKQKAKEEREKAKKEAEPAA